MESQVKRAIVLCVGGGVCAGAIATLSVMHYMTATTHSVTATTIASETLGAERPVDSSSDFCIPAGALRESMVKFGAQTGITVIWDGKEMDNVQTNAVEGRKRNGDALAEMVAGTHLQIEKLSGDTLLIMMVARRN
jgi:hypothetical protein